MRNELGAAVARKRFFHWVKSGFTDSGLPHEKLKTMIEPERKKLHDELDLKLNEIYSKYQETV